MDEREAGVDFDCPFTFVTLANQSYATEVFFGRKREAEKRLDQKAADSDVLAVYLYGPSGYENSFTR